MICATVHQLDAFNVTLLIGVMWNAAVIGSFGFMLFDVLPARRGTVALIASGFALAFICLVLLILTGGCQ